MPRYFFDTDDGNQAWDDTEGLDLPDHEAARRMAIAALPDMAKDRLPTGDRDAFDVRVRDEAGTMIYSASLKLVGEWHVIRPT